MWAWLNEQLIIPLTSWLGGALAFFIANATTVVGFILALLIIRRVLTEKRNPSNFFAWFFLVLFFPLVGVPLYFMFGGRKSRKTSRIKREIADAARSLIDESHEHQPLPHDMLAYEGGNTVTTGNHFELLPDAPLLLEEIEFDTE